MDRVRAALFLDFDNVFGGLHQIDPAAAMEFAWSPGSWVSELRDTLTVAGPRRWLVLRCYMNPDGSLPKSEEDGGGRVYFSKFRRAFTQAGFEVIDCPRLSHTKNAADIRLVLDAMEACTAESGYEEFVIASGDSDMTPLLVRLRAADRRTTILSPSDAAEAFTAVADRLIGADQVLALVQGEQDLEETDGEAVLDKGASAAHARARQVVEQGYAAATAPLNLSQLAAEVGSELDGLGDGVAPRDSNWFGAGSFVRFLARLDLPHMKTSQHHVWDTSRHDEPEEAKEPAPPAPVTRLTEALNIPRLPQSSWSPLYDALADFAATQEFKLAEATRWGRDRLVEQELDINRPAVGVVTRAVAFGGAPLHRKPPPSAREIGTAFVDNLLDRATAAGMTLTTDEVRVVRGWFGDGQHA